jgi:hypothetical protein
MRVLAVNDYFPVTFVLKSYGYFLVAVLLACMTTSRWTYLCSPSEHQDRPDYFLMAICTAST